MSTDTSSCSPATASAQQPTASSFTPAFRHRPHPCQFLPFCLCLILPRCRSCATVAGAGGVAFSQAGATAPIHGLHRGDREANGPLSRCCQPPARKLRLASCICGRHAIDFSGRCACSVASGAVCGVALRLFVCLQCICAARQHFPTACSPRSAAMQPTQNAFKYNTDPVEGADIRTMVRRRRALYPWLCRIHVLQPLRDVATHCATHGSSLQSGARRCCLPTPACAFLSLPRFCVHMTCTLC